MHMNKLLNDGLLANRRQVIKGLAAGGATAALGMPYFARAQTADTIRIGYIDQFTGMRSNFAETAPWVVEQMQAHLKDGIEIGGKRYAVEILQRDSQSD